jgi:predicted MFS family arabinose efflux permease
MFSQRLGTAFPRVFTAALLQEISFILLVHFPGYLEGLGVTESLIGVLYAASAGLSLLLRPALGRILDLTHRRTVLLISGVGATLVLVSLVFAEMWGPFLWVLFLAHRVLQITLFTAMLTYAADTIPVERRTQGLAIFGLSGLLPISIGAALGDVIIDVAGFDGLFLLAATAGVASWLLVWRLPVLPVPGRRPRRGFWSAFAQRTLLPIWMATLFFAIGIEILFTFTRTYVDERQVGTTGLFFGVYGAFAVVTRLLGGSRYDRIPHRPLLIGTISMFGFGIGIMALAESAPVLVLAALVAGTAHGALFPILSSQVVNRARTSERGSAMAIFTSLFDVSLLFAAPTVGVLIDKFDYRVGFGTVAVTLIVGSILYGIWDRQLTADAVSRA